MSDQVTETVALTKSIADWLGAVGITEPELKAEISVDVADIIAAARQVETDVQALLQQRPGAAWDGAGALSLAANIEVQLFTELASHLGSLRRAWPRLLKRLDEIVPGG